jgi:hypothetical protein
MEITAGEPRAFVGGNPGANRERIVEIFLGHRIIPDPHGGGGGAIFPQHLVTRRTGGDHFRSVHHQIAGQRNDRFRGATGGQGQRSQEHENSLQGEDAALQRRDRVLCPSHRLVWLR